MNTWEIVLLFFGFQAFLLSIFFYTRKEDGFSYANKLFALFLLLSGWLVCYNPLFWSRLLFEENFIHLNFTYVIPLSLLGPIFFFYIRHVVTKKKISFLKDLVHFIPFFYMMFSYLPYYLLDSSSKLEVYMEKNIFDFISVHDYSEAIIVIAMAAYAIICLRKYTGLYQGQPDFKLWLKAICFSFLGIVLSLVLFYCLYLLRILTTEQDYLITLMISVSVFVTSYFSFNYNNIFNGSAFKEFMPLTIKYKKTGLSESYSRELKENLLDLMVKERPYLDGELRLDDVAKSLGISRHHASQIINEHFGTNFFDFINIYRTEEAVRLLKEEKDKINLSEIGFIAGFNNTVSFNKAFKKNTGLTPSKFRKKVLNDTQTS